MSPHRTQVARPGIELTANLERTGIPRERIEHELGFSPRRLTETLRVGPAADPADVWLLRDYLDRVHLDRTGTPLAWEVLDEAARSRASRWFALHTAATPADATTASGSTAPTAA